MLTYADVCFRIQVDQAVEARIIDGLLTREADILLLAKHYAKALPERFMQVSIISGTKVLKLVVLKYFQTLCQSAARVLHAGEHYLWY